MTIQKTNKQQIIEQLAETGGISLRRAKLFTDIFFESISEALANGDRIEIRGFGSFSVKSYNGYKGRNPKTGDAIKVNSKKLPIFKVALKLKERVDSRS